MLKFLVLCISRLPLRLLHAFGALLGGAAYRFSSSFRGQIDANLAQAGYADPALRRAAAREIGKSMFELPAVWLRSPQAVHALVRETEGWEHVTAAQAAGRPLVCFSPHMGCFEIIAQDYAYRSPPHVPMTALYRPPRKAAIAPLIEAGRTRPNLRLAAADLGGVRALLRALKSREAIGILPDQAPRFGEGVWAPFFGRMAFTMTLAARLAQTPGAAVLLMYAERLPRGRGFRLVVVPLQEVLREPFAQDPAAAAAQFNGVLEALIRRVPAQYLWSYNRYKVPPGVAPPPAATVTSGSPGEGAMKAPR